MITETKFFRFSSNQSYHLLNTVLFHSLCRQALHVTCVCIVSWMYFLFILLLCNFTYNICSRFEKAIVFA